MCAYQGGGCIYVELSIAVEQKPGTMINRMSGWTTNLYRCVALKWAIILRET